MDISIDKTKTLKKLKVYPQTVILQLKILKTASNKYLIFSIKSHPL